MDEIDILDYWYMVSNRRKVVIAVLCLAILIALVYVTFVPATYEASASLIFSPQASGNSMLAQLSGVQSILGGQNQTSPAFYSQILKSRRLKNDVRNELEFDKLGISADKTQDSLRITMPRDGGLEVTCSVNTGWFEKAGRTEANTKAAEMAADMVNSYVRQLQAYDQSTSVTSGRKNRIFIESELRKTRDKLTEAEDEFKRFREKNPDVIPVDQSAPVMTQLAETKAKQLGTQAERDEIQKRLDSTLAAYAQEDREILTARVLSNNPVMMELRSNLVELEIRKAKLLENLTEKHPDVVATNEEIDKIREKMTSDLESRITSSETMSVNPIYQRLQDETVKLQVEKTGIEARESALGNVIRQMERSLSVAAGKQTQYVRLLRDMKALEQVYTTLLAEYSKAQITEAKDAQNFSVLDWAEKPKKPVSPRKKLILLAAAVFGCVIGCLLAITLESLPQQNRKHKKTAGNIEAQ